MARYPIETVLSDLRGERASLIKAMMSHDGLNMDEVRSLAALQGAIAALEAQIEEESPRPDEDSYERPSYEDD